MELFKSMTGVNIVHIPYKGAPSSTIALVSGQVQLSFASAASVAAHVKSGRLKALAVTTLRPSVLAPGVPTVAASVPGYESVSISGMFAPARTPAPIILRINREVVRVLSQPDVKEKFLNLGAETVGSSPEQLAAAMKSEVAKWAKVIQDAGITLE
jgi:tripartite-type tricarboxylate transporter receptor subunit TctC